MNAETAALMAPPPMSSHANSAAASASGLIPAKRLTILTTQLPRLLRRFALIYPESKVLSNSLRRFVAYCERYEGVHSDS